MENLKFNLLETSLENSVFQISLNRPEVHNALNQELIYELTAAIQACNNNEKIRLIIIRGKGKSFSSGADLHYMREQASMSWAENLEDAKRLSRLFLSIYSCTKPVITVAHGNVAGGANGILAASDYAICTDDTIFRFSEVRLGLVPATIAPYVLDRIGRARSAELLLSGRAFTGNEAEEFCLVNNSVPAAKLDKEIENICSEFLKTAPGASAKTKELLRILNDSKLDPEQLEFTANIIASARASEEGQEGIKSFFESRMANWNNESIQ